jgi:hypothetical protein
MRVNGLRRRVLIQQQLAEVADSGWVSCNLPRPIAAASTWRQLA